MGVIVGLNSRWSRENYERNKQAEVIQICVTRDSLNFVYDMSVEDAETLVNDLTDWIREVKPYNELHDADEQVLREAPSSQTELPSDSRIGLGGSYE